MKKIILFLSILVFVSCSENKKTYKYIEIIDDESITGEIERIGKDTVVLEAENDSLAYLEAYNKFSISKKVHFDSMKADIKTYSTPIEYKLIDEKGNDIMSVENVFNLIKGKAEIDKSLSTIDSGIKKSTPEVKPATKIDEAKIKELKQFFSFKTDEFSKETWVSPKTAPKFRNRNGIYCCFISNNSKAENFRIQFQYSSDDWLFIERCQFLIDGKTFEYIPREVQRDNGNGDIWEWFDEGIDYSSLDLIEALASAKNAKVKIIGRQYHNIKIISNKDLSNIKKTLALYKAMGGRF